MASLSHIIFSGPRLNIGIRGPPGRSLEPRHILLWHTTVGWEKPVKNHTSVIS